MNEHPEKDSQHTCSRTGSTVPAAVRLEVMGS